MSVNHLMTMYSRTLKPKASGWHGPTLWGSGPAGRFGLRGREAALPAVWWRLSGLDRPAAREQDGTGLESDREQARLARLEAVLFLAKEPLAIRKLAQLAALADGTEARTLVSRLRARYDARSSSFQVEEVAGGFQLLTRSVFAKWLRRVHPAAVETRLSVPAMETLAVVAYCQPVLRADIEAVRGVQCGEILRQLMDRDLVRIAGRSEVLGRPFLYGTTRLFLQLFGLRHLDDLPRADLKHILARREDQAVEKPTDGDHDIRASELPSFESGG